MTEQPRVCRRCLLEDMEDERPAYRLIGEWLDALPPERRADEGARRARLNVCARCDELANGLCALCGCYVELRAAMRDAVCPCAPAKW